MLDSELFQMYSEAVEKLDSWKKLSIEEREAVLQQVENFDAMRANRPPATVKIDRSMSKTRNGYYDTDNNLIVQNFRCIKEKSPDIAVKNILHEGRHAYQYDCVQHPERHSEISKEKIAEWKENFNSYILPQRGSDFQSYFQQPVEIDARLYAHSNYEAYLNKDLLSQNANKILSQEEVNYMWKGHKKEQEQGNQEKSHISAKSQIEAYKASLRVTPEQQEVNKKWNAEHQKQSSSSSSNSPDSKDRADSLDRPRRKGYSRGR